MLANPLMVTTTFPLVAPAGTVVAIAVGDQLIGVVATPLKVIVFPAALVPKLVPEIVTPVPMDPEFGDSAEMAGAGTTVNAT